MDWRNELDERQQKELAFALAYAADYAHGTDGHHRLLLIAKLAHLLDDGYGKMVPVQVKLSNGPINPRKPAGMA